MQASAAAWRSATILWIGGPALVVAVMYHLALGHRSDYLGHYAPGFGGTIIAMMITLAAFDRVPRFVPWLILTACLAAIMFGVFLEATIFRIGRFDEVDFCNQSLGAVLAALVALRLSVSKSTSTVVLAQGIVVGLVFLAGGFWFAFN